MIFQKQTKFYKAEIKSIFHLPTSLMPEPFLGMKFEAKFETLPGVKPSCYLASSWETAKAAHKMIDRAAKKYDENGGKWNPVT